MSHPTEEQITTLREFTGLGSREALILFLKGNNNDITKAADAFFDNPNPARYESQVNYDESHFASDRQGAGQGTQDAPFQLDDDDTAPSQFGPLTATAPSRPPSRQYGPQPAPEYGTLKSGWESSPKEEYEGENEAIKRSLADQQTGIVNASGQEIVPDVDSHDRQRGEHTPAFLKHMLRQDFLPSLITILHSVPKLRNALLSSEAHLHDYGFNSHWWSGEDIQTSTISFVDDDLTMENASCSCPPIVAEVQRLIAFLDKTERAYASAESLARVHAIKVYENTSSVPKSLIERFVETWDSIGDAPSLFLSTVTDIAKSSEATRDVHMYDARIGFSTTDREKTLVDVLDNCFWDVLDNGDFEPDHFLDEVGPVQILTLRAHKTWKLVIPPTVYLDRYLLSNSHIIHKMKAENSTYIEQINKANSTLKKLETYKCNLLNDATVGPEKEADVAKMFERSIDFLADRSEHIEDENIREQTKLTVAKLEKIWERIEQRVHTLRAERQQAEAALRKFSSVLTEPGNALQPEDYEFKHQYVLRGIATSSPRNLTTYVLRPSPDSSSVENRKGQWWKMAYDTAGSKPHIERSTVTEEEVLKKAGEGVNDTMLAYTSAATLTGPPPIPLPPQLERFVDKDNTAFRDELAQAEADDTKRGPGLAIPTTIAQTWTRSVSQGSDDSMTVNRDDEAMEMEDRDQPPPYDGLGDQFEDVRMDTLEEMEGLNRQPEMKERSGQGRPGLFDMPSNAHSLDSDAEMEGP